MIINHKINIAYVGILSEVRLIHKLLDAIKDFNVTLHIAGAFDSERYETKIKNHPSFKKVKLYGYLDSGDVYKVINKSDFCLLPLKDIESYRTSLPVKLFEYMSQGKFVLAQNFKTISNIVKKHDCGLLIDFQKTNEIITAINYSIKNLKKIKNKGLSGIEAVRKEYNWNSEFKRLEKFYKDTYLRNLRKKKNINESMFKSLHTNFFRLCSFKNIASKILSNKKLSLIYSAAAVSFIMVLVRDFYIINYTNFSKIFFSVLYISSISCSFSINAISLNSNQAKPKNVLFLCFISFFIFYFLFRYNYDLFLSYQINFFNLYSIILFWILGSMFSRHMLEMNLNYFIARSRETFSSILFIFLIFFGMNLIASLITSVAIGTLILLVYLIISKKNYISNLLNDFTKKLIFSKKLFINIFLANFSIILINLWALYFSSIDTYYFDISSISLARLSVYIFQIITLGSIYFSLRINLMNSIISYIKYSFYFFLVLALITLQSFMHFILFPIALSLLHYYFVHRLNEFKK